MARIRVAWALLCLGATAAILGTGLSDRSLVSEAAAGGAQIKRSHADRYAHSLLRHKELKLKLERQHNLRQAGREKRQIGYLKRELHPKHKNAPPHIRPISRKV